MRMERTSTDTRTALLDAAIDVIEESGEAGFRISAVLDRVGVASTAIYHHFGSRDDLVDSANAERYLRTLFIPEHEQMVEAIERCGSADEFEALIRRLIKVGQTPDAARRRRTRVAVLGSAVSRPSLAAKVDEANTIYARSMAEAFRPAQARGWMRKELDLEDLAMWQIGQSTSRFMTELSAPTGDRPAWAQIEEDAILAVVTGRSPASPSTR